MLGVLGGSLAPRSLVAGLTIRFLVVKVKLRQLALEDTHPAIDHNLAVVQRANLLLALLHLSAAVRHLARGAALEQRLGRVALRGCKLGLPKYAVRVDLGGGVGGVGSIRLQIAQS